MISAGGTAAPLGSSWAPADANTLALYQQMQMSQFSGTTYGGGALYNGVGAQAPFNPYGATAPATQATSGFTTIGPVPTAPVSPQYGAQGQVVYAHYGYGQAQTGATTTAGGAPAAAPAPAAQAPAAPAAAAAPAAPKPNDTKKPAETKKEESKPEPKTVTVKSGDSLSKIAAAHGTTWQKLYELNKGLIGGNPNLIRPGQELKLP